MAINIYKPCVACGFKNDRFDSPYCKICCPIEARLREAKEKIIKDAEKESNKKMNIKDAIIALYEGKKVRSLGKTCPFSYVLRDGKIDYVDKSQKYRVPVAICQGELDGEWEIIEDE